MITVKKVKTVPREFIECFTQNSRTDWHEVSGQEILLYSRTKRLWALWYRKKPLAVIGVVRRSLIGNGIEVYVLLCRAATDHKKRFIRFIRRAFQLVVKFFRQLVVSIDPTNAVNKRFVEFLGLRKAAIISEQLHTYELRASWR